MKKKIVRVQDLQGKNEEQLLNFMRNRKMMGCMDVKRKKILENKLLKEKKMENNYKIFEKKRMIRYEKKKIN